MCCSSCGSEMEQAIIVKKPSLPRGERPGRVARRAKQDAKWSAKRIAAGRSPIPSLMPLAAPAASSSSSSSAVTSTAPDAECTPFSPFEVAFLRSGRHRFAPTLKPAARLARRPRTAAVDGSEDDAAEIDSIASSHDRRNLIESWGLRFCACCNRLWCRDKNADRNMMSRALWLIARTPNLPHSSSPTSEVVPAVRVRLPYKLDGPSYLCRQPRVSHSPSTETTVGMNPR